MKTEKKIIILSTLLIMFARKLPEQPVRAILRITDADS